jgi:hypothetical protein
MHLDLNRIAIWLVGVLPRHLLNAVTAANLGRLTVVDKRLHSREVPTITIEELVEAMRVDETGEEEEPIVLTTNGGSSITNQEKL